MLSGVEHDLSPLQAEFAPGDFRRARVVERRKRQDSSDPAEYEYYVHFKGMNRRMDEWRYQHELDLGTVEPPEPEDPLRKGGQKRKLEHDASSDEDGHGDFDPQQLKEHEEFTKVKNIGKIELGRYEMDTWYFSPFPPDFRDCRKLYFCEFTLEASAWARFGGARVLLLEGPRPDCGSRLSVLQAA